MTGNRKRLTLACFIGSALLAGGNGVSIRFSNRELPPLWGAGLRFSLAAVLLLGVMAVLRLPFPGGRALTGALLASDDYGSSVERTGRLHPLWQQAFEIGNSRRG